MALLWWNFTPIGDRQVENVCPFGEWLANIFSTPVCFHMLLMILGIGYFGEKRKQNKTEQNRKQNKKKQPYTAEAMPLFPERKSAHVNYSRQ